MAGAGGRWHRGAGLGEGGSRVLGPPEGSLIENVTNNKVFPWEKLFGAEWSRAQSGWDGTGVGYSSSYGAKGSAKAYGYLSFDGNSSADHWHKRSNAIWEQGPGSGEDGGKEGHILGSGEKQELLGGFDEGLEKEIELGLDMAFLAAMQLLFANTTSAYRKKKKKQLKTCGTLAGSTIIPWGLNRGE